MSNDKKSFFSEIAQTVQRQILHSPLITLGGIGLTLLLLASTLLLPEELSGKKIWWIIILQKVCLNTGIAIIGAGIFTAIVKSGQFSELYEKIISEVIYNPGEYQSEEELISNWNRITKSLLVKVINSDTTLAVDHMQGSFFNKALGYHYERYNQIYTIKWFDYDNKIVQIRARTSGNIVTLNNSSADPDFFSEFSVNDRTGNEIKIEYYKLDSIDVSSSIETISKEDKLFYKASIPLKSGTNYLLDRKIKYNQCLIDENYLISQVIRYAKNLTIEAKYEQNELYPDAPAIKFNFMTLGVSDSIRGKFEKFELDHNTTKWRYDGLLLPNQGYIIFLTEDIACKA